VRQSRAKKRKTKRDITKKKEKKPGNPTCVSAKYKKKKTPCASRQKSTSKRESHPGAQAGKEFDPDHKPGQVKKGERRVNPQNHKR